MQLEPEIINPDHLADHQIHEMYELMVDAYQNIEWHRFNQDLAEKNWAILLYTRERRLAGFSTLMLFDHDFCDERLSIAFSGDTVICRQYQGTMQLPVAFGRLMNQIKSTCIERRLYWMLISKGFRTYRFLPVFFKDFYPRYDEQTPSWEMSLIESLSERKYPGRYNDGVIKAESKKDPIIREKLDIQKQHVRRRDPHISFFLKKNAGYVNGDELVCIAPYHDGNLVPYITKQLNSHKLSVQCEV